MRKRLLPHPSKGSHNLRLHRSIYMVDVGSRMEGSKTLILSGGFPRRTIPWTLAQPRLIFARYDKRGGNGEPG
jgi:hypothetical protein